MLFFCIMKINRKRFVPNLGSCDIQAMLSLGSSLKDSLVSLVRLGSNLGGGAGTASALSSGLFPNFLYSDCLAVAGLGSPRTGFGMPLAPLACFRSVIP